MFNKLPVKSVNAVLASLCFLLAATLVFNACTKDAAEQNQFNVFASKASLLGLSANDQKEAWITRLESYKQLDLREDQQNLVNALIADLKNLEEGKFYLSEDLKRDAIAIAQITPEQDFINLFTLDNLSSGLPALVKQGSACLDCIYDIQQYTPSSNVNPGETAGDRRPDCNCRWTCSQQADNMLCDDGGSATVSTDCNQQGGCGFFGLQTCDGVATCDRE
ncbi:MAG: bacteriocin fulvocin C-related protein [Saprospiraceae bacterium]|nr:bacteriocin fulvocin C-related protein [Saprospiraceae bacterium]